MEAQLKLLRLLHKVLLEGRPVIPGTPLGDAFTQSIGRMVKLVEVMR